MAEVIYTENLSKHYGKLRAVDNLSLSVKKGEIYGFLGLNGAGKTTTIRMMLGMIQPSSGASYLNGQRVNPGNYALWGHVGYMVEIPYAYPELSVSENLEIIRKLRSISAPNAVNQIIAKLRLQPYIHMKAKHLSLGNAQRLGIAKALLHNPGILILDEPTIGLDPAGIVEIRELLLDLAQNHGVTIFISSHILGEIAKLTSRIGIIHNGLLIQEVDSDRLDFLLHKSLGLKTIDNVKAGAVLANAGHTVKAGEDGRLELCGNHAIAHPEEIARILVQNDCPPTQLKVEAEDLESYFLRIIQQQTGG